MNLTETTALLNGIALYDNREVDLELSKLWHRHLAEVTFDEAAAAVHAHFDETSTWIMPSDVMNRIRAARTARLYTAHVVYDGNPDETGAQFAAQIRARLAAIADGHPTPPLLQALGRTPEFAGAEPRELPPVVADAIERARPVELSVPCPVKGCKGTAGKRCGWGRTRMTGFHPSRTEAAQAMRAAPMAASVVSIQADRTAPGAVTTNPSRPDQT